MKTRQPHDIAHRMSGLAVGPVSGLASEGIECLPDQRLPMRMHSGFVLDVCSPTVAGAAPELPRVSRRAAHRIPVSTHDRIPAGGHLRRR